MGERSFLCFRNEGEAVVHRCEIEPLPQHQFSFRINNEEVTRWHFGSDAPRPFFWPIRLAGCSSLTRLGHPGAPNHDHHRSLWFAHHSLHGIDFWSEESSARIEQTGWYCIEEADEEALLAFELEWRDGHEPAPLVKQVAIVRVRPIEGLEAWVLELHCTFITQAVGVAFHRSNFGVLGLRVAKSLSVVFGEGQITGADGGVGEHQLFGKPNRWIDYSGPVRAVAGQPNLAGLTLIDAATNPGHASGEHVSWHVRDDGWIGPSLSRHADVPLEAGKPLSCKYALLVHPGPCQAELANRVADELDQSRSMVIRKANRAHRHWQIERESA